MMEKIVEAAIKVVEIWNAELDGARALYEAHLELEATIGNGYCKYPGHCACGGDALAVKKTCSNWRNVNVS